MDYKKVKETFGDVLLNVTIELGRKKVSIGEMLSWDKGTIVKFNKTSGESVDFLVNNRPLAFCEVMVIEDKFAVRITEIMTKSRITELDKDGFYD